MHSASQFLIILRVLFLDDAKFNDIYGAATEIALEAITEVWKHDSTESAQLSLSACVG